MDLRAYYQKIRDVEATIDEAHIVVMSLETADGGKPGVLTEVARSTAAKMIVDGVARKASGDEARTFLGQQTEAHRLAVEQAEANKVRLSVVPTSTLNELRAAVQPRRD